MTACRDEQLFKRYQRNLEDLQDELDYVNEAVVNVTDAAKSAKAEKQLRGLLEFMRA